MSEKANDSGRDGSGRGGGEEARACPTCGRRVAADAPTYPFCGKRCRDVDLGRWFAGDYLISRELNEIDEDMDEP